MSAIWKYIVGHKTRILGYVTVVTSLYTAVSESLRVVLTKEQMAWAGIVIGGLAALFGHLNASKPSDPPAE